MWVSMRYTQIYSRFYPLGVYYVLKVVLRDNSNGDVLCFYRYSMFPELVPAITPTPLLFAWRYMKGVFFDALLGAL